MKHKNLDLKKLLNEKIMYYIKKVKTKNVLLLPDDEFPIANSIKHIYFNFKKSNRISSGIGVKFHFDYKNPKIFYPINHHSFHYYNLKTRILKKLKIR